MNRKNIYKLEIFFSHYKKQTYRKKEILIRADENPLGVYYIKSGLVKAYTLSKKGDETILNILKPNSFFPMPWVINDTKNSYYFEAMTAVEVWRAPKEKVLSFVKKENDILYDLLSRVYKGTEGLLLRLTHLRTGNAHARLVTEIIINTRRFGKKVKNTSKYFLKIREKDLARQAGMTRETVSREMKVLKDTGLISFEKNILEIYDIGLLELELKRSY